jgi:hypothetical protein
MHSIDGQPPAASPEGGMPLMRKRNLLQIKVVEGYYRQTHHGAAPDRAALDEALLDWTKGSDSPAKRYEAALTAGAQQLSANPTDEELAAAAAKIILH